MYACRCSGTTVEASQRYKPESQGSGYTNTTSEDVETRCRWDSVDCGGSESALIVTSVEGFLAGVRVRAELTEGAHGHCFSEKLSSGKALGAAIRQL
ncbi:UNVERIFIED_CONTAM: hypothetical protein K2H54_057605 [Gekko kuhli]